MINISMDSQILSTLMSCARLCNYRFNLNLVPKGSKSNSLEAGSLVHVIQEHYAKAIINGKQRADAISIGFEYGKLYRQFGDSYLGDCDTNQGLSLPDDGQKYEVGWNDVIKTMAEYFDYWRADNFVIISAEEVRQEVIYEDESLRVLWKAKFDRIIESEHGFISMDHKTMKQRRDTISLNNQFIGQCRLLRARQVLVDKIGFQKSLKPSEKFERVLVNYSMDRIAEWTNEIVPYYARMLHAYTETGYWPPNFTHCENKYGRCQFAGTDGPCEADRNMRDEVNRVMFDVGNKWDVNND